jgi:putative sigma-54 modulation protein
MKVEVTGRHVSVTEALKSYAAGKVERFSKLNKRILDVHVILSVDGKDSIVEVLANLARGGQLAANERHESMYAAIDLASDKLMRQLQKLKEKVKDHHHRGGVEPGNDSAAGSTQGGVFEDND